MATSLLLTAGKLGGLKIHAIRQTDLFQRGNGAFPPFLPGNTGIEQGQCHIVHGALPRQQIKALEYEADGAVADSGQLLVLMVEQAGSV